MHCIFDIALNSDIPLPELPEIENVDLVFNVRQGMDTSSVKSQPVWLHHWEEPDGSVSLSCARLDDSYLLRFPELVDFVISSSGESILYFPESEVTQETIRHLLLDQVVPRILGHQGNLILHASAIRMLDGTTVAFVGASGSGKSTLAASFHQGSATLITDDCLLVEEKNGKVFGIPNYYGVRLLDDSVAAIFGDKLKASPVAEYSSKSRIRLPQTNDYQEEVRSPLSAIFLIKDDTERNNCTDEIMITPIRGANELISLIKQSFILDVTDKLLIKKQFQNLGGLISSNVRIFSLQYPRKHDLLPAVRSKIESAL
jgi:hypothetical protein